MVWGQQNEFEGAGTVIQLHKLTASEFNAYNRLADHMDLFVSSYHAITSAPNPFFTQLKVIILTGLP